MKWILAVFVVGFILIGVTSPAWAYSNPQPRISSTTVRKVVCMAASASIGKDAKTVRCPGGRIYKAPPGKKYISDGPYILEVDSGGILGRMLTKPNVNRAAPLGPLPEQPTCFVNHGQFCYRYTKINADGEQEECSVFWDGHEDCIIYPSQQAGKNSLIWRNYLLS